MTRTAATDPQGLGSVFRRLASVAGGVRSVFVSAVFGVGVARGRRTVGVAFAAVLGLSLSGCFSDPPPDPAVAPIEVVASTAQCLLNRESVGTGTHEVVVIMEHGSGKVRLLKDGAAVLTRLIREQSGAADQSSVELQQGQYVVECTVDGALSMAQLTVTG